MIWYLKTLLLVAFCFLQASCGREDVSGNFDCSSPKNLATQYFEMITRKSAAAFQIEEEKMLDGSFGYRFSGRMPHAKRYALFVNIKECSLEHFSIDGIE